MHVLVCLTLWFSCAWFFVPGRSSAGIERGSLIQAVHPLSERKLIERRNVLPFIFLDLAIIVADLVFQDLNGWLLFALPPVFLLHLVSFISVYWSADIAAFLNYRKVCCVFRVPFDSMERDVWERGRVHFDESGLSPSPGSPDSELLQLGHLSSFSSMFGLFVSECACL